MQEPGREPAAMALLDMGEGRQGRKGQQHTQVKRSEGPFDGEEFHDRKGWISDNACAAAVALKDQHESTGLPRQAPRR
jgi:hypothetical protein